MRRTSRLGILLGLLSFTGVHACSIVGYIGDALCKDFIMQGLERLEYRGYDSAGFAGIDANAQDLIVLKAEGKSSALKTLVKTDARDGRVGIGHTRWATHGPATTANAHPHMDGTKTIAVVHNGIIENFFTLKEQLIKQGHVFASQTDTEVIPHLLQQALQEGATLEQAAKQVASQLHGTFAIIALFKNIPDVLLVMRKTSPLCVGFGANETFVASDFLAFAGRTNKVTFIPDASFAIIKKNTIAVYDFAGAPITPTVQHIEVPAQAYQKFEHEHFMIKEIYEQPKVIRALVAYYKSLGSTIWASLGLSLEYVRSLQSVHMFGCGTSWHAARIGQFFFEVIAHTPSATHLASEFRYMPFFAPQHALYLAISQSGETADTLEALRLAKSHHIPIVTITNVPTSTMARESQGFLPLKAGPEIAVASTKAFTTQITALYWLAHCLAIEKGILPPSALEQAEQHLLQAADVLEQAIEKYRMDIITTHAKRYAQAKRCMYLGRHIGYPFAMEGALKLKEISYIFAQGYPAGELKHGSIALVDIETPVLIFSHLDPLLYAKLITNTQEVRARKGHVIAFAFEGQDELIKLADQAFILPRVAPLLEPLAMAGLMQFFAYQIAKELGRDIDQPRNLAKAVTVE